MWSKNVRPLFYETYAEYEIWHSRSVYGCGVQIVKKKTKTNKSIVVELTGRTLTENNFRGKFELVMSQHNEQ